MGVWGQYADWSGEGVIVCGRECLKVGPAVAWVRDGFGDTELHGWVRSTSANLDTAVAARCGAEVKPDSTVASDWITGELGKVKVALVPDCRTVEGVRRAVGLLALPGCLWLQERPNDREGSVHAGRREEEYVVVRVGAEPAGEVRLVEAMEGLPELGEGSRSGPREYMLSGKSHGVSARRVGREVDVGAVVGDLFNAGAESASRLLGGEFGVLATESVTDTYVPVLGHVEEAASVVESTRGWLRPVGGERGEPLPRGVW